MRWTIARVRNELAAYSCPPDKPEFEKSRGLPHGIYFTGYPIENQPITPSLATKVRKVALSVRMYAPISSAMTRQAPMPVLADTYQSV